MTLPRVRPAEQAAVAPESWSADRTAEPVDIERLFRERAGDLAARLRRRVGDADIVRDVVQEAFARFAALAPARRARIDRPDAYLLRTGANLLTDWGRAAERRAQMTDELVVAAPDPVAVLEQRERLRRLEHALARMRPKTRAIFIAHRLDGLRYAQIAARFGLSVKGVEKQMSKAIALIDRLAGDE